VIHGSLLVRQGNGHVIHHTNAMPDGKPAMIQGARPLPHHSIPFRHDNRPLNQDARLIRYFNRALN
jgi:hypothetical protein